MSLTDIMSGSGLVHFAEAALLLFVLAFLLVVARTFAPGRRAELDRIRHLPLDDDDAPPPRSGATP